MAGTAAKVILKYPLEVTGVQTLAMPRGAKILTCQLQRGVPTIWAACPVRGNGYGTSMEKREIALCVTGGQEEGQYLGTVLLEGGDFVAHFYERKT